MVVFVCTTPEPRREEQTRPKSQLLLVFINARPITLSRFSSRSSPTNFHLYRFSNGAPPSSSLHMAKPSQSASSQPTLHFLKFTPSRYLLTQCMVLPSDSCHIEQHSPVHCYDNILESVSQWPHLESIHKNWPQPQARIIYSRTVLQRNSAVNQEARDLYPLKPSSRYSSSDCHLDSTITVQLITKVFKSFHFLQSALLQLHTVVLILQVTHPTVASKTYKASNSGEPSKTRASHELQRIEFAPTPRTQQSH